MFRIRFRFGKVPAFSGESRSLLVPVSCQLPVPGRSFGGPFPTFRITTRPNKTLQMLLVYLDAFRRSLFLKQ